MRITKLVGPGLLQEPEINLLADERELETLRAYLLRELAVHKNLAGLAREIRVGRIVLRKFLALQSIPTYANLNLIRDWTQSRPPIFVPFACVLLSALTRWLPGAERARARAELAESLAASHQRADEGIPDWLRAELGMTIPAGAQGAQGRVRAPHGSRTIEG